MNQSDIINAVFDHGQSVNAVAESESAEFFRVNTNIGENFRVDQPGATHFNPASTLANATTFSATFEAGNIGFESRLNERKIAWSQSGFCFSAKQFFEKFLKHSF